MTMANITAIIPTYNRASLILETLEAVFAQTQAADEIIVVDDGSTDDTAEVMQQYRGRLKVIRVENGGDLVARNIGLRAASGDLAAFCDSDDLWEPEFLASMAKLFLAQPGITAAYSNFRILRDGVLSRRSKFDDAPHGFWQDLVSIGSDSGIFDKPIVDRLLKFQPLFTSAMMVNRVQFADLGNWDESVKRIVSGDFATALRVGSSPPIGICRSPLVCIRKHASNFSGDTEKMNLGDAAVLEHVLATRPELSPLWAEFRDSMDRRRGDALHSAFSRRDFPEVRRIDRLIHAKRSTILRIKSAIAALPRPLAMIMAEGIGRLRHLLTP
jgi:glycosyltransferase involved in cell wall biosynthesis